MHKVCSHSVGYYVDSSELLQVFKPKTLLEGTCRPVSADLSCCGPLRCAVAVDTVEFGGRVIQCVSFRDSDRESRRV